MIGSVSNAGRKVFERFSHITFVMGYWNDRLKKEAWNPFKRSDPAAEYVKALQNFQWSAPDTSNCRTCKMIEGGLAKGDPDGYWQRAAGPNWQGVQPASHIVRFIPPPNPYAQRENPNLVDRTLGESWERDHTPYDQYLCPQHLQSFQEQAPFAHPHEQNYTVSQL